MLADLVADHDDLPVVLPGGDYVIENDIELREFDRLASTSHTEAQPA